MPPDKLKKLRKDEKNGGKKWLSAEEFFLPVSKLKKHVRQCAKFSLTKNMTAAQHVQRQILFLRGRVNVFNPANNHNKDDFSKPVVNCRTGNRNTT